MNNLTEEEIKYARALNTIDNTRDSLSLLIRDLEEIADISSAADTKFICLGIIKTIESLEIRCDWGKIVPSEFFKHEDE